MSQVAATVLIPTHDHGPTLRYSVPTALTQTVDNIEVFIIGDGVSNSTRSIIWELAERDARIKFFDFPKGPNRGEAYRHAALGDARGEIVCYLLDDDLWLPDHIETMRKLLHDSDFAFSMPALVAPSGRLAVSYIDLSQPPHLAHFCNVRGAASTPTCAAHTLAMYRRLPFGWRTTPSGFPPDKYMWAQFFRDSECKAQSTSRPTAIIFPDLERRQWTIDRRLTELAQWTNRIHDPEWLRNFPLEALDAAVHSIPNQLLMTAHYWQLKLHIPGSVIRRLLKRFIRTAPRW